MRERGHSPRAPRLSRPSSSNKRRAEEILRFVTEATSPVTGDEFFRTLMKKLATTLGVRWAFVTKCLDYPTTRVRILAYWSGDGFADNHDFDLPGTPCERVIKEGKLCFHPRCVGELFEPARRLGRESYIGIPIFDSSGARVIGHITVQDDKEMGDEALVESVFRVFAARAGAEILRMQAAEALQASEQRYRKLFDHYGDAIFLIDPDEDKILDVNPKACEMLGYTREELLSLSMSDVHPEEMSKFSAFATAVRSKGHGQTDELTCINRRGQRIPVEVSAAVFLDGNHGPQLILASARDITDRKQAQQALARLQGRNVLILQAAGEGIYGLDAEGKTSFVNPAAAKMLGWSADELIGQPLHAVHHHSKPDGSPYPAAQCPIYAAFNDGKMHHVDDEVFWRKDGSSFPVEYTSTPIFEDGRLAGAVVVFWDISERKRAHDELRASEERYRSLYTKTPVMLHSSDANRRLVSVSDHWLKTLGYERSEVIGQPTPRFLTESSRQYAERIAFPEFFKKGFLIDEPIQFKKKNGEIVDVLLSAVAERDLDNNIVRSTTVSVDVTERKRAEEAVKRYTKRLEILQELDRAILAARSPAAIGQAAVAHIRQLMPCRRATVTMFDFDAGEGIVQAIHAMGETDLDLEGRIPLDAFGSLEVLRLGKVRMIADASTLPDTPTFNLLRAEGLCSWINVPLIAQGELIGTLNVGSERVDAFSSEDIEAVREVADTLAIAIQQARLHDQVKRQTAELERRVAERTAELEAFSYSVSHDLRAPLRAIAGFSRVLLEDHGDKLDDECTRLLHIICENTRNMGQLIDDLLAFSRLRRQEMKVTDIDMGELARSVLNELKSSGPERKVQVHIGGLPIARGDRAMIRQVLANLLSNAFKFTQRTEAPRIEIDHKEENDKNAYYVKDNGIGFDMRYAEKIFGVFQRLHRSDEFEGTGVGLAIVQSIIQRHGGSVWAAGKINEGATIYFTLPHGAAKR